MEDLKPGQLVCSKAGRDKGKRYLILKVLDRSHVLLVDGRSRPFARPKKKNTLHLQPYNKRIDISAEEVSGKLTDERIARYILELTSREATVQQEEG